MKKQEWTIAAMGAVLFCLIPWVAQALLAPDAGMAFFILFLLLVNPAFCFFTGLWSALRSRRFCWQLPLILGGLFFLSEFLFYNDSATVYAAAYLALNCTGQGLGLLLKRKSN